MSLLFERESLLLGSASASHLRLHDEWNLNRPAKLPSFTSESITWRTVGNEVEVSVALVNDSDEPTTADILVIEAAGFGAFIPNQPAARIAVGSLEPGEEWTATVRVPLEGLPAARLARPSVHQRRMFKSIVKDLKHDRVDAWLDEETAPHWIGNFNVYFDRSPENSCERHVAFGLLVPKESIVLGMFSVGTREFETCAASSAKGWQAELVKNDRCAFLFVKAAQAVGEKAQIRAEVTRIPDKATVVVEFEFETVEGWGESAGCVEI